ncbi:unnamed protein product [Clonostachys byssicola]|uniref:Zn(2)-C6 fungal-type domain-containing protein n=1 Tax=Clonostachys byssicola TaxID=160290 RepID=A0A9N9Y3A5_9HYPO|nr:unnamed protein product [Clonostachys byssicola]
MPSRIATKQGRMKPAKTHAIPTHDQQLPRRKGCSLCTKRRIRCDLSAPSCKKCIKKGLACPGYDSRIRWVGGAAIRGHLKGLGESGQVEDTQPPPPTNVEIARIRSLGGYSLEELVEYYDKHVARIMVWLDGDDNVYRRHVLPLAHTNPVVRLAVAAISAQHAAFSRGDPDVPEDARNEAVAMISRYIHDVTCQIATGGGRLVKEGLGEEAADWILASMLVLSCYEMFHSGAAAAEFHRTAAKSFVNTLSTTEWRQSTLFLSLRNKLSTYDVFACTTSFDLSSIRNAVLPDLESTRILRNETVLFLEYLVLLHEVTLISRQPTPPSKQQHIRDWKEEFELARGATLMAAGRLNIHNASQTRDLIRLVDIHHHAALLYVAACFGQSLEYDEMSKTALRDFKAQIVALENINQCIHNLPWPLFILGVRSHGHPENRELVSKLYRTIPEITGCKQYYDVLEFLHEFWSGSDVDWQPLARKWELRGNRILAF